jgi:hypothetical protein
MLIGSGNRSRNHEVGKWINILKNPLKFPTSVRLSRSHRTFTLA